MFIEWGPSSSHKTFGVCVTPMASSDVVGQALSWVNMSFVSLQDVTGGLSTPGINCFFTMKKVDLMDFIELAIGIDLIPSFVN